MGNNASDNSRQEVEEFVALVGELAEKVQALPQGAFSQIGLLDKRGRWNRRWLWILGPITAALIAIGVLATYNTVRLDHALNVQRTRACAFYTIFLQADTPQAREASPDKEAYDHAFEVIRSNYVALNCTDTK